LIDCEQLCNIYVLAGLVLRLPIWQQPGGQQVFDDASYWTLPDEGFPSAGGEEQQPAKDGTSQAVDSV